MEDELIFKGFTQEEWDSISVAIYDMVGEKFHSLNSNNNNYKSELLEVNKLRKIAYKLLGMPQPSESDIKAIIDKYIPKFK